MIHLENLSLRRGNRELLRDASLRLHAGERIGVIGPNGCGKSSLFALLTGSLSADGGSCHLPADWPIAQMEQEISASPRPAVDFVLDGDPRYRELEAAIAVGTDGHQLAELHAGFEAIDGWSAPARAHGLLAGLGFEAEQHQNPVSDFSGGWRTRLALARALMTPSRLLLLDEPTNHLDIDAIEWLEIWLKRYPGTLLLISHDRDFLDAVVNRIVSFDALRLDSWRGNYSDWEQQRAERLANQQASYQKQQERVRQIEAFVARFRAKATKARQAQSRLRELERMERIDPAHVDSPFRFSLPCADKVSTPLIALQDVALGYDGAALLSDLDLSLQPGQRVGLLGPNGAGKSTLVRGLVGELKPLQGRRQLGDNLRCGYFAQHQLDALDAEASPLLHLQRLDDKTREQTLRDFLGGYGFHGDMAVSPVLRFSGGERARLALALLAWQKPNLLLLDEPTNHLDLEMRHALVLALQQYPGAVVLVSHDRHLLRNTVDEFWLLLDGRASPWDGDLPSYQALMNKRRTAAANYAGGSDTRRDQRRESARRRAELRPMKQQLVAHEKDMDRWQQALELIEQQLGNTELYQADNAAELSELLREQGQMRQKLAASEEAWLQTSEALEAAERST